MTTNDLHCCAVSEISGLSGHKTPEEAMAAFCSEHTGYGKTLTGVGAFYIFTGVTKVREGSNDAYSRLVKKNLKYGPEFAAFIKKARLGTVTLAPSRVNRGNHPTHTVNVWVWSPNVKNLIKWWGAYKAK